MGAAFEHIVGGLQARRCRERHGLGSCQAADLGTHMLFSAKAEYACVAMLELAARLRRPAAGAAGRHRRQARHPQRFLVQILLDLKRAGLVASTAARPAATHLARIAGRHLAVRYPARDRPARAAGPPERPAPADGVCPQRPRRLGSASSRPSRRILEADHPRRPGPAEPGNAVRDLSSQQRSVVRNQTIAGFPDCH